MRKLQGFTLIELLVVIFIILVAVAVLVYLLNPLEIIKEGRDSIRFNDLKGLEKTLNLAIQDNINNLPELLCSKTIPPCSGSSTDATQEVKSSSGSGWVKMDFKKAFTISILPIDPVNDPNYFYKYSTDFSGKKWEINAKFESLKYLDKMRKDEGNNDELFEIGSDKTILP